MIRYVANFVMIYEYLVIHYIAMYEVKHIFISVGLNPILDTM